MKTNERLREPEEPFFATEQDFQKAVNKFYEEWRNRPKWEATTGFDEWKVAQLVQARARLDEVVKVLQSLPLEDFTDDMANHDAAEFVDHAGDFFEAMQLARRSLAELEKGE